MSRPRLALALALGVVVTTAAGCTTAAAPGVHLAAAHRTTTTVAPTTLPPTTTTTVDPGSLPQTNQLPSDDDPLFTAHMADLFQAVAEDEPAEALPSFFPLLAYIEVKGISDPIHDYETRLIPDFDEDIDTIHAELGPDADSAVMTGVSVPTSAAEWILPGVEYNKGSYWRVYDTEVDYTVDGRSGSFEVTSMISWRGEWYVVHLGGIR
ncbi:MAG TPA: hypothetical protein VK277_11740 [Acidimicrobiales bacterium]|nr:hypothetical protein [Acidimicrobiales bacterium]